MLKKNIALSTLAEKLKRILESESTSLFILAYGFFCWFLSLTNLLVYSYVFIFVLTLLCCKNLKNIYAIVLFVAFFIKDITGEEVPWASYIIAISSAIFSMACFLIKNAILNGKEIKKGEMAIGFIFAGVALLLGGIGRFNPLATLITAGLFIGTYLLYFIIVNFTEDFKNYLMKLFITASVILCAEFFIYKLTAINGEVIMIGTQHVNVFSEYLLIGLIFAFAYGISKKQDFAYLIIALVIMGTITLTTCSTTAMLSIGVIILLLPIMVIKSPNRKLLIALATAIIVGGAVILIAKRQVFIDAFARFFKGDGQDNGRKVLWPWTYGKFKENPFFGHGFISEDYPPTTRNNYMHLILAHNTALQWLASLGVVGTSLMVYFYLAKYKLAFKNPTIENLIYALSVIAIGVCGLIDQAPSMDFFMFFIPLGIVGATESKKQKISIKKPPR